jgi:CheY-like chemotaxis protein
MIRRVGEPKSVAGAMDAIQTWRIVLSEPPSRVWRHGFLERACALGLFFDSRIRLDEATVVFELERTSLRVGLERLDECVKEANAECGYAAEETVSPASTETVLVVDDEVSVRELTREILRQAGFTVLDTGDPREALRIAQGRNIRLLLTDVVMPMMHGRELAERLRSFSPQTGVLYMSAYSSSSLPPGARFIAKPFSLHGLVSAVRDALNPRSPFSRRNADPRPRADALCVS